MKVETYRKSQETEGLSLEKMAHHLYLPKQAKLAGRQLTT